MTSPTESDPDFLKHHGIDAAPEELDRALALAISERQTLLHGTDDQEFPPEEHQALQEAGLEFTPRYGREEDPVTRSIAAYSAIIKTALTTTELAARIARSQGRIRQLLNNRELYGIQPDQDWLIPSFQIHGNRLLPGLGRVLQSLPDEVHPLEVEAFFLQPHPDLRDREGRSLSPRDWLISGRDASQVVLIARYL